MNTTPLPAQPDTNLQLATLIGVIELLISPEFGDSFVRECCDTAGVPTTQENVDTVTDLILAQNKQLAAPLIATLPEPLHTLYTR